MPLILYTYLVREMLAPFLASLVILLGVLFAGRMMQALDIVFDLNIGLADFVRFFAFIAPTMLLHALPMASLFGVIVAFNRIAGDNEIIALKAAGIGLYRLLPPVLLVALGSALATAFFSTQLIPAGTVAMENLFIRLAKEKVDKGIQAKRFSESLGDIILYVDRVLPADKSWEGVYVSDLRDPAIPLTIVAKTGTLQAHLDRLLITLELRDGSLHRAVGETTQTISFDRYTLNIPLAAPRFVDEQAIELLGPSGVRQGQLLGKAAALGKNSVPGRQMLAEFHTRLALPVGCFVLTLLGFAIALQPRPGRRSLGLPLGLAFFVLYYLLVTVSKGMCESGNLPVALLLWWPNLFFAALAAYFLHGAARESWLPFARRAQQGS